MVNALTRMVNEIIDPGAGQNRLIQALNSSTFNCVSKMPPRPALQLLALLALSACGPTAKPLPIDLLQPPMKAHWQPASIPDTGSFSITANEITLPAGKPMSGMRFEGWASEHLPVTDYEITLEARRVEGRDFFAALTFPVRSLDTCATLVLGGWGGDLVGISSIDGQDASENSTRSSQRFTNGQWYRVRLRITDDDLMAWLDDRLIINTSLKGRKISLRMGDIEACAPFGLATYATTGQVRKLMLRRL